MIKRPLFQGILYSVMRFCIICLLKYMLIPTDRPYCSTLLLSAGAHLYHTRVSAIANSIGIGAYWRLIECWFNHDKISIVSLLFHLRTTISICIPYPNSSKTLTTLCEVSWKLLITRSLLPFWLTSGFLGLNYF